MLSVRVTGYHQAMYQLSTIIIRCLESLLHDLCLVKRFKTLFVPGLGPGQQEKQSPTMDGWNRLMNNIPTQQNRNQQNQFNPQQNSNNRMMQPNQFNQQPQQQNMNPRMPGPGNSQWQQTMNMVRTNMNNTSGYNDMSGYNNSYDNYNEQSLTYPSNFPNQQQSYQQPMDQMQSQPLQQQTPLVVQQPQQQQPFMQSLPSQQSMQYGMGPGPSSGLVQQQPVQYMTGAAGGQPMQGPSVAAGQSVAGPQLVVQQQPATMVSQPLQTGIMSNPTVVNPNQILYQASTQNSYMQPAQLQQQPPMMISATPGPGNGPQPVVLTQPGAVQLVTAPSQPSQPLVVQYSSQDQMVAPTPALITAPTPAPPAPILVNNTALPVQHPPVASSNSYAFDPSGLTPAQQLAYAQAQQQHQQQHLKKMRQRLPHVSGRELHNLHRQIKDLQHKQHMQTLQTLRLAQVQEKQAFNYLDSALKTRQKPNTYHRVNFQLKVYCS